MQMQKDNFKTFSSCSSQFDFKNIPFSKVVEVRFSREYSKVKYKTSWTADSYTEVDIIKSRDLRTKFACLERFPSPKSISKDVVLSQAKINDIRDMLKYMPIQDQQFYKALKI